jgi:carbamoyltransferase
VYLADHSPSACIVRDGKILAAVEEERLTKVKHYGFCPPYNSIMEVFRIAKVSPKDIDAVAIPWESPNKRYLLSLKKSGFSNFYKKLLSYPIYKIKEQEAKRLLEQIGITAPLCWVEHHKAHASSVYFTSGFNESTVVTIDGWGDGKSSVIYKAKGTDLKEIGCSKEGSLGAYYLGLTEACGFKPNNGEGKTMGIASYGDPKILGKEIKKFIWLDGLKIRDRQYQCHWETKLNIKDERLFSSPRHTEVTNNPFGKFVGKFKKEDIAAAGQDLLEIRVIELVKRAIRKTGCRNLCLAGGVAMNVKMNMAIKESGIADDVYICPNPADTGSPLGAALYVCIDLMKKQGIPWNSKRVLDSYYGREYSDKEIKDSIEKFRLASKKIKNPSKIAAELIAKGKVVGWFQGKNEYGPRALGNRSVLADPRKKGIKEKINKYLKKRDWFMPFAPSILLEDLKDYVENPVEAPFMIMAFEARKNKIKEIPSAIHVDGTLRPQTVRKDINEKYYDLIYHFKKLTGVPLILNTSFNKHGIPMIMSPDDAMEHVVRGDIEFLVIGNYLIDAKVNLSNAKAAPEFADVQ